MKMVNVLTIFFALSTFSAIAQDKTQKIKIEFADEKAEAKAKRDGFDPALVAAKVAQSKTDLEKKLGKDEVAKMSPIAVTYKLITEDEEIQNDDKGVERRCRVDGIISVDRDLDKEMARLKKIMLDTNKLNTKGVLFIQWGYNRGFHSKSDITVKTDKGSYTIKDAHGDDRPSALSIKYLNPSKFSIPQYNLKLGYWFSKESKFGIGLGTDHMKWIFDAKREYEIEGDYTGELWVKGQKKSFDEIIAGKDASFLLLEHTDGYNYPYIEGLYREKLINTKRFEMDAVAGAGAGILFPKTRTRIADRENSAKYRDIDNKFKVAGYAFHADASLMLKYKQRNGVSYYVKPTVRGVAGKINNALYYEEEGQVSQSTIYTLEPSVNFGTEIPLNVLFNPVKREARKELRVLKKMKKLDEKNDKDEKSLEKLQEEFEAAQAKAKATSESNS